MEMNFRRTIGVLDSEQWKQKIAKDQELAAIRREGIKNEYGYRSSYNLADYNYNDNKYLHNYDYNDDSDLWGGGSHPSSFFD